MKELEEVLESVRSLLKRLKMVELVLSDPNLKNEEKREIICQSLGNFSVDYLEFMHKLLRLFNKYNSEV